MIIVPREIAVDVAMMLNDIDHFKSAARVTNEDHVAFEGEATKIGAKLKPSTTDRTFDRCKLVALGAKLFLVKLSPTFTLLLASAT